MRRFDLLAATVTIPVLLATAAGCTPGAAAGSWVSVTDDDDGDPSAGASSNGFAEPEEAKKATAEDKASWTFFVYAKGDGVRSPALAADIASIGKAQLGSSSVKVVVLADFNAGMRDSSAQPMFTAGSTLYTFGGNGESVATHSDEEQDFDDPSVMSAAITSAFEKNPAKHHGLVIWSRGDDAKSVLGVDTQNGSRDGSDNSGAFPFKGMSVDDMKKAIKDGVAGAGMTGERPLDVIGFDLSSPGRIESLFALSDVAKVFVSNATSDGVGTWAYEDTFSIFALNPTATGADFAKLEDAAWQSKHAQTSTFAPRAHIAFDTSKMDSFTRSTDSLVRAIKANPSSLSRVASAASFASVDGAESGEDRRVDFARFASALAGGSNMGVVTTSAQNASHAFASAMIGTPESGVFGFSVALPSATSIDNKWFADNAGASRDWDHATGWNTMLQSFSKAWDTTPPTIDATFVAANDIRVGSSATTRNAAASASASLVMKTNGVFLSFGHIGAGQFSAQTGEANIAWNKSVFTADNQPARAIPWRSSFDGSSTVALVGRVIIGTQAVPAAVVATAHNAAPTTSTMFILFPETANATPRSAFEILALDAKATFTPSVQRIDQDLNRPIYGSPIAITTSGIAIAKTQIDFGNYEVAVSAKDIWGNETIITKSFFAQPY